MLRPLLYHFSDDPGTYQIHDQVMLGPWLMAAPVYQPGRESRAVYLPKDVWYDWWTGERIDAGAGPRPILVHAPLERMPLYARAGAIVPSGPALSHTDERPLDRLTLDLFPGDGALTLYEDDGHSFAHEQGQLCTTRYDLRLAGDTLTLTIGAREGGYAPPAREVALRVQGRDGWKTDDPIELDDDGEARRIVFRRPAG